MTGRASCAKRAKQVAANDVALNFRCSVPDALYPCIAPEPFERPYCVDVDRRETGGTVRTFTLPERPAYFGQDHKTQALKAELEKLRVENQAMRSELEVIDRTLMTVQRAKS